MYVVHTYNGYTVIYAMIVYLLFVCHNHYTNRRQHKHNKHKTCTLARTSDGRKHHNNRCRCIWGASDICKSK